MLAYLLATALLLGVVEVGALRAGISKDGTEDLRVGWLVAVLILGWLIWRGYL